MSYEEVMARVSAAAVRSGRDPADVTVVAVSKTVGPDDLMRVYEQGHRDFGENRAQELAEKAPRLPNDIRWHFVGSLQSNKARMVRGLTHLLHSLDRRSLGSAWMKGIGRPPPVLVQVNTGAEPQKSGVTPDDLSETLDWAERLGLRVDGLMCLPPIPEDPEDSRPHFRMLRTLREASSKNHPSATLLSMGMTHDFEIAIEEGASLIRVGRAIFGPRKPTGE